MGYAILLCISGIELPSGRALRLQNSVLERNPLTLNQSESSDEGLPNATLFKMPRLPDGSFKEASRYLIGIQSDEDETMDTKFAKVIGELEIFPLRLMTEASICVGLGKISQTPLPELLRDGCQSVAPAMHPLHLTAHLDNKECELLEKNQALYTAPSDLEPAVVTFVSACYESNAAKKGLGYLMSVETLVTPDFTGKRGRASETARFAGMLAASNDEEEKLYRSIVECGYKHRNVFHHGEIDLKKRQAAEEWFNSNAEILGTICRRVFQRVLCLRQSDMQYSLEWFRQFLASGKDSAKAQILRMPVFKFGRTSRLFFRDFTHSQIRTSGSGSVEFI